MRVGLHNHTCFSDGRLAPQVLVDQAFAHGYERLAITDHNLVAGWQSLATLPDWVIPGIELSVLTEEGSEVHLLGLYVQPQGKLLAHTERYLGLYSQVWSEGVQAVTGDSALAELAMDPQTRPQCIDRLCRTFGVAQAVQAWATGHHHVYETQLRPHLPHWREGIAWLRESGAVVGLAHPERYGPIVDIDRLIEAVDAVEVVHPSHSARREYYWGTQADKQGKARWGSHDYHGWSHPQQDGLLPPILMAGLQLP